MKKKFNLENAKQFKSLRDVLNLEEAIKESNRCLLCEDAPCSKGCPAGTDPGKFIRQIKFENYKGAARTIRNNNCLGTICGIVCPVEKLCEKECSAKALEDPINIGGLQRFACEYGKQQGLEKLAASKKNKGKIAVIGAGPAGLSCAYELAKADYDVTIYEQAKEAGGVPRWEIPSYRLPTEIVQGELQKLKDLGVSFKLNSKIASSKEIKALIKNYKAVFIGVGLSNPKKMSVFDGYKNAMDYKQFLQKAKKTKTDLKDQYVIVIGGGSVAMDAAGTAKALGAKKVIVVYRRQENEMPADEEEKKLAHALGVAFKTESVISEVLADKKRITFVKGIELDWKKPRSRNTKDAKPIPGAEFTLKADLIIQAIGTGTSDEFAELKIKDDFSTNIKGVFCGGDVINGGQTVVQAVSEGKRAAKTIKDL